MIRTATITLVAAVALAAAGCGGSSTKTSATTSQERLTDLHTISQLQTAFQKASDQPRLIVLLSPT